MGCVSTHHKNLSPLLKVNSINGRLRVTIQSAHIDKKPSVFSSTSPYLRLRMSNQQYCGQIHKKAGKQPVFNETYQFTVNSCYVDRGRTLTIELWNESKLNNQIVGVGTFDLDPIINTKVQNMRTKIYLINGVNHTGYVNALIEFKQQPTELISFKFQYANIRKRTSLIGKMKCWVEVIMGEEILHTSRRKDSKNPPSWTDQVLIFTVPQSLKHCYIRVFDELKQIGMLRIAISELLESQGTLTQQIEHEDVIVGTLKFTVTVGKRQVISDIKKQVQMKQSGFKDGRSTKFSNNRSLEESNLEIKPVTLPNLETQTSLNPTFVLPSQSYLHQGNQNFLTTQSRMID